MNKSILLVDDKEEFKNGFQTLAQRKGYKLAWCKSLQDLKEKLPKLYLKITAIILDIKCLIKNDQAIENENFILEALLYLEFNFKDLPRVVLTGDEKASGFSRFSSSKELIFRKEPTDIERMFEKIEEFHQNHNERIKTEDEKEFYKIIEETENQRLEFKSSLQYCINENREKKELRFEVIKTLAAFANTDGGILLIGVEDNKNIYGLDNGDFKTINKENKSDSYKLLLDNLIENYFGNAFHSIVEPIKFYTVESKVICKIFIKGRYSEPVYIVKKVPNKPSYKAFFKEHKLALEN